MWGWIVETKKTQLLASWRKFARYIYLMPLIYLTKIAWCWGFFEERFKI